MSVASNTPPPAETTNGKTTEGAWQRTFSVSASRMLVNVSYCIAATHASHDSSSASVTTAFCRRNNIFHFYLIKINRKGHRNTETVLIHGTDHGHVMRFGILEYTVQPQGRRVPVPCSWIALHIYPNLADVYAPVDLKDDTASRLPHNIVVFALRCGCGCCWLCVLSCTGASSSEQAGRL